MGASNRSVRERQVLPVRMDYRQAISSVRSAARALSGFVEQVYE